MSVPAAGWYPDPDPAGTGERFWDGSAWTPQTRPFLQQGTPSPTPASPAAVASTSAPEPEVSGAGRQAEETAGQPEGKVRRRKRNKSSRASYGSHGLSGLLALMAGATLALWVAEKIGVLSLTGVLGIGS